MSLSPELLTMLNNAGLLLIVVGIGGLLAAASKNPPTPSDDPEPADSEPVRMGSDQRPSPETIAYLEQMKTTCPGHGNSTMYHLYAFALGGLTLYESAIAWNQVGGKQKTLPFPDPKPIDEEPEE
jgi:hypothetical protein